MPMNPAFTAQKQFFSSGAPTSAIDLDEEQKKAIKSAYQTEGEEGVKKVYTNWTMMPQCERNKVLGIAAGA